MKESSKKKSQKPNAASQNNTSWSTDTDGLLEHTLKVGRLCYKRPALQKIIPSRGPLSYAYNLTETEVHINSGPIVTNLLDGKF